MRPPIGARIVRGLALLHDAVDMEEIDPLYQGQGSYVLHAEETYLDRSERDDVEAALVYLSALIGWYDAGPHR